MIRLYRVSRTVDFKTERTIGVDKFVSIHNCIPEEDTMFTEDDIIHMTFDDSFEMYTLYEKDIPIAIAILQFEMDSDNNIVNTTLVYGFSYYSESFLTMLKLLLYSYEPLTYACTDKEEFRCKLNIIGHENEINIEDVDDNHIKISLGTIDNYTILSEYLNVVQYYTKSIAVRVQDETYDIYVKGAMVANADNGLIYLQYRKRPNLRRNIFTENTCYNDMILSINEIYTLLSNYCNDEYDDVYMKINCTELVPDGMDMIYLFSDTKTYKYLYEEQNN